MRTPYPPLALRAYGARASRAMIFVRRIGAHSVGYVFFGRAMIHLGIIDLLSITLYFLISTTDTHTHTHILLLNVKEMLVYLSDSWVLAIQEDRDFHHNVRHIGNIDCHQCNDKSIDN